LEGGRLATISALGSNLVFFAPPYMLTLFQMLMIAFLSVV